MLKRFQPWVSVLLILRSCIRSIIGFSILSNADGVSLHVHQNGQFPKSMYQLVSTHCLEVASKLLAHSTSMINMVTAYEKQLQTSL